MSIIPGREFVPGDAEVVLGRMIGEAELAFGEAEESDPAELEGAEIDGAAGLDYFVPELEVMDDDEVVQVVRSMIDYSDEGIDSELVGNWTQALKYYLNRERITDGCIDPDTHVAVSSSNDVADMIESVLSQIMPALDSDVVFSFNAQGNTDEELDADERAADLEAAVCNHVLMSENSGYLALQTMFRDALLMRFGVVKVSPEISVRVLVEEYENLTPQEFMVLNADPNVSIGRVGSRYLVRRYTEQKRISVTPVPQEEMRFASGWRSPNLDGIQFICHTRVIPRNDLIEMGYATEIVEELPQEERDERTEVRNIRSDGAERDDLKGYYGTPGTEPVRYSECYVLLDYDNDGYAELRKVCLGGRDILLENVPVSRQPFAMAVPILRSHRMSGISLFDRLRDVQDLKSEAINQHVDNLRLCNFPEQDVIWNQVNAEDVLVRFPGKTNRLKSAGAVTRVPPQPVGNDALAFCDYLDKVRSERGGASLDLQSAQVNIAGNTAHGVERQVSSKEMMASFFASTLIATGLVPIVQKIHAGLRESPQSMSLRSNGRTMQVNPAQWPERTSVGAAAGFFLAAASKAVLGIEISIAAPFADLCSEDCHRTEPWAVSSCATNGESFV